MKWGQVQAARLICELKDWKATNLELQKILYIAHMIYLGNENEPLIIESFEAWDYGPVIPELYQHVKGFGANPVKNVFHSVALPDQNSSESDYLKRTVDALKNAKASHLVGFTHREGSAWSKAYSVGKRGVVISDQSILGEYHGWKEARQK